MTENTTRPLAVAIIGSGPSGFYAAEALLKTHGPNVRIDFIDRLPTPFGLVRGGVAPDHQKIKSVIAVYEKTAADARVRFFGNIKLGRDLTVDDLRARYDQIVYAVGCESDRHMAIPGEDLKGSYSATEFVGWYNSHPDHRDRPFDLSCSAAAIVGVGNVAMDVTRILSCDAQTLAPTDIAAYALEALRSSRVKTVWLLGRRGIAEASYSPAEIEEIGELPTCDLVVNPQETVVDDLSKPALTDAVVAKKVAYVQEHAKRGEGSRDRKVRLRFLASPVEILGMNGRVSGLRFEKNTLVSDGKGGTKAMGTGQFETISVGLVLRSVGYRGVPIPGVSFDEKSGHIPNDGGRVTRNGAAVPGEYVVGWAKRGPSGLIGTNRADSVATVGAMSEDAKAGKLIGRASDAAAEDITRLFSSKALKPVSFADWKKLDALEKANGVQSGKVREKFTRLDDMIKALSA